LYSLSGEACKVDDIHDNRSSTVIVPSESL